MAPRLTPPEAAETSGYSVTKWLKNSHAESAALHAALRIGLLRTIVDDPGVTVDACADRCGISRDAAIVLTRVLRLGGVVHGPELRAAQDVTTAVVEEARAAADREAARWPSLADPAAVLTDELLARLRPEADEPGATWLMDRVTTGHLRNRAVAAAVDSGALFSLADGGTCAPELKEALERLEIGALTQLLSTDRARSALKIAGELAQRFWPALGRFADVARTGALALDLHDEPTATSFYRLLARYNSLVFPAYFRQAAAVAAGLRGGRVLDVGAGSGVWGAAFAREWPDAEVGFLDRAQVLDEARRNARRLGVSDRTWFAETDLAEDGFGEDVADVLVLGQICHTQPSSALPGLFAKCATALRHDGVLVVADMALDASEISPAGYVHFGIKEFVSTAGMILTIDEYAGLLADAGFATLRCHRFSGLDVFLASKNPRVSLPASLPGSERLR